MKLKHFSIAIIILLICESVFAQQGADFALYTDNGLGTWEESLVAFENFLDWKGISHERILARDLNNTDLRPLYQAIFFPGGYAWYYKQAINESGLQHIRNLVSSGGAYLGICAGAYFACDSVRWEEDGLLDYPLDLFDGVASGAIDNIAPWDTYSMTSLDMNRSNIINSFEPAREQMLYYGGPVFKPHNGTIVDTLASWSARNDSLAILNFFYGSGRVLLIGPHPEIEEDSNRDSSNFAEELVDGGSDWPFLWSATDWLLGRPITYPPVSSLSNQQSGEKTALVSIFPNPFNQSTQIRYRLAKPQFLQMKLLDSRGRLIQLLYNGRQSSGKHAQYLDASGLATGVYFLYFKVADEIFHSKILFVK